MNSGSKLSSVVPHCALVYMFQGIVNCGSDRCYPLDSSQGVAPTVKGVEL